MDDLAYPIKLDDDYPCRGTDAVGETQTFNDLLTEGMVVGPEVDGDVIPTGEVVRRDDGLWAVAECSEANNWKCRLGFHRWGPWKWDSTVSPGGDVTAPAQHRYCLDCPMVQGPLVSSEERRYHESWRDRR